MRQIEILFGAVVALIGFGFSYEGLVLGYVSGGVPGSGFFPFWVGLLLLVSGLAMALSARLRSGTEERFERGQIAAMAGTAVYLGLIVIAGTVLATFAYLLTAIGVSRRHGVVVTAVTSIAGAALIYFSFRVWLQIPLPRGILFGGG